MGKPLDVFNLGDLGVNNVDDPLVVPDGSLRWAQNALPVIADGEHALSKRPGLAKFTTSPLAGPVLTLANIYPTARPVPPAGGGGLAYPLSVVGPTAEANAGFRTVDGVTWLPVTAGPDNPERQAHLCAKVGSLMVYPSAGTTAGRLCAFDGATQTTWLDLPQTITIGGVVRDIVAVIDMDSIGGGGASTWLYVLVQYWGGYQNLYVLWAVDTVTKAATQLGEAFCPTSGADPGVIYGVTPTAIGYHLETAGILYVGGSVPGTYPKPVVYRRSFQVAPESWVLDHTFGGTGATDDYSLCAGIEGRGTNLFIAWSGPVCAQGPGSILKKRTPAGVWSTLGTMTGNGSVYHPVYAFGVVILIVWELTDTYTQTPVMVCKRSTDDGATWSTLLTLDLATGYAASSMILDGTRLFGIAKIDGPSPAGLTYRAYEVVANALVERNADVHGGWMGMAG